MPPRPDRRPSRMHDLLDPDIPFPGGHEDRITIELPCMYVVEEDSGAVWMDVCLSLRGGGEMAVVELPTRFEEFQAIPSNLWREFWERTRSGVHFELMSTDQRFGTETLLNLFVYLADNHDVAEDAWHDMVAQLEMAAVISGIQGRGPQTAGPVHVDHAEAEPREHADWFVYGMALWASGQWPNIFPRPHLNEEGGEGSRPESPAEEAVVE